MLKLQQKVLLLQKQFYLEVLAPKLRVELLQCKSKMVAMENYFGDFQKRWMKLLFVDSGSCCLVLK